MRSDAVRNRSRILDAAQGLLVEQGADVGMDEIAQAAGVAVGTLYRHFPTKRDLVVAALEDRLAESADEIEAAATRVEHGASAKKEITALILDGRDAELRLRTLKDAAALLGHDSHRSAAMTRITRAIDALLDASRTLGEVRAGITASDVYLLLATMPTDETDERRRRWLELILTSILSDS